MNTKIELKKRAFLMFIVESGILIPDNVEAMRKLFNDDQPLFFERALQIYKILPQETKDKVFADFSEFDRQMRMKMKGL